MLALIAIICFVLAALAVDVAGLNLLAWGLAFMATHLLFDWRPWVKTRD